MRFEIKHPTDADVTADYGWDRAVEFFVTVYLADGEVASYDRLHRGYAHLDGALRFLAKHGFFSVDELEESLMRMGDERPEDMPDPFRGCAEIVMNLKGAAA